MSDLDALNKLAGFVGKSPLLSEHPAQRQAEINGLVARLEPRPLHKKASELLSIVLALSARTRRIVQPRVAVDLDCFTPTGHRAVCVTMRNKTD